MSYSGEDIKRQLQLGEDSDWEFKQIEFSGNQPRSPGRNDLADGIAAFANSIGGVLLCRVTDEGEAEGMTREQIVELDKILVEVSSDSIKPAVRIRTHHRQLPNGKRLLVVEVPRAIRSTTAPGGSFFRVGGSKRRMTSDERLRLAQRRGQAHSVGSTNSLCQTPDSVPWTSPLWKPLLSAEGAADPRPL